MDRPLLVGFAPALDVEGIDDLHHADALFVPDPGRAKYGRAPVYDPSGRGSARLGGVAVVWGGDDHATRRLVAACPDPVVVVVCERAVEGGPLATEAGRMAEAGRCLCLVSTRSLTALTAGYGVVEATAGALLDFAPRPKPAKPPAKPKPAEDG